MSTFYLRKLGLCLASLTLSTGLYYKQYQTKSNERIILSDYASRKKTEIITSDFFELSSEAEISELMYKLRKNPQQKCRPIVLIFLQMVFHLNQKV